LELEAEIAKPDFWDRGERAQERLKEHTNLKKVVEDCTSTKLQLDDIQVLIEMGEEGEDEETLLEVNSLLPDLEKLIDKMEFSRMLSGEHDANNATLSINAGAGGTEAQDWADIKGFKVEFTDYQPAEEAGIKSATFTVEGDYAYGYLRSESGIHRLVRISPFDANAKRHTSFCSVFIFPELDDSIEIEVEDKDLKKLRIKISRSILFVPAVPVVSISIKPIRRFGLPIFLRVLWLPVKINVRSIAIKPRR